jgi:hypothetical protein
MVIFTNWAFLMQCGRMGKLSSFRFVEAMHELESRGSTFLCLKVRDAHDGPDLYRAVYARVEIMMGAV